MFHPDVCTGINLIETGKRIDAVMRANGVTTRKLARAINGEMEGVCRISRIFLFSAGCLK